MEGIEYWPRGSHHGFFTIDAGGGLKNITEALRNFDPQLTGPIGPPGWWPLLSLILLTSVALALSMKCIRKRLTLLMRFSSVFFV